MAHSGIGIGRYYYLTYEDIIGIIGVKGGLLPNSNIDNWISEFPGFKQFIMSNTRLFSEIKPSKDRTVGDAEWNQIVKRLHLEADEGTSTG